MPYSYSTEAHLRQHKQCMVMCYKILHNLVIFDGVNIFNAVHFLIPDEML